MAQRLGGAAQRGLLGPGLRMVSQWRGHILGRRRAPGRDLGEALALPGAAHPPERLDLAYKQPLNSYKQL